MYDPWTLLPLHRAKRKVTRTGQYTCWSRTRGWAIRTKDVGSTAREDGILPGFRTLSHVQVGYWSKGLKLRGEEGRHITKVPEIHLPSLHFRDQAIIGSNCTGLRARSALRSADTTHGFATSHTPAQNTTETAAYCRMQRTPIGTHLFHAVPESFHKYLCRLRTE